MNNHFDCLIPIFFTALLLIFPIYSNADIDAMTQAEDLKKHVYRLALEIGERNVFHPEALHKAEEYIIENWKEQGYEVVKQEYNLQGIRSANLEVTKIGTVRSDEIILVGAHYDSVVGSPGANDNGSGVAVLLEIARQLRSVVTQRSVRFVAFANEEPPFFSTEEQGSQVYARAIHERGDNIRLMISLETMGYFRDEPNTQSYPPLFRYFYPDRGNFIAFVSNFRSGNAMHAQRINSSLRHFEMARTRLRKLRINRASSEEAKWLAEVLNREDAQLGTRAIQSEDLRLALQWNIA